MKTSEKVFVAFLVLVAFAVGLSIRVEGAANEVPLVCVRVGIDEVAFPPAKVGAWERWECWPKGYPGVPMLDITWQRKAK